MSPRLPRPRTFVKWLVTILAAILIVPPATAGVALATYLFMPLPASLPQEKPQADSRVSVVYDVSGQPIGEFREAESRVVIPPDQIPHNMKIAVIASEDQHFYKHSGVDWRGIARAFWADVRNRSLKQGGSTITQQLAKNLYTDGSRTITRKAKEALIAAQVERVMTKNEIIAKYLNTVYMGDSVFGVEAAAQSYFKKPAKDLTLAEAALLAGVLPAPSLYSPRSHPEAAESRRQEVLNQIEGHGLAPGRDRELQRLVDHGAGGGAGVPVEAVLLGPVAALAGVDLAQGVLGDQQLVVAQLLGHRRQGLLEPVPQSPPEVRVEPRPGTPHGHEVDHDPVLGGVEGPRVHGAAPGQSSQRSRARCPSAAMAAYSATAAAPREPRRKVVNWTRTEVGPATLLTL